MTIEQLRFQHAQAKSAANVPKVWYTADQFGQNIRDVVLGGVGTIRTKLSEREYELENFPVGSPQYKERLRRTGIGRGCA